MRGSCLCGQIEFQTQGSLPKVYQCHRSLCRKQGGSSSNSGIIVDTENFRWIAGEGHISSYVRPTGFRSDFCSRCGSPVPNPLRGAPYYWVPAGLLDGAVDLKIAAHLFVGSKASWDEISRDGAHYDSMPGLSELIELTRAKG
jgi:hypothetical protein